MLRPWHRSQGSQFYLTSKLEEERENDLVDPSKDRHANTLPLQRNEKERIALDSFVHRTFSSSKTPSNNTAAHSCQKVQNIPFRLLIWDVRQENAAEAIVFAKI